MYKTIRHGENSLQYTILPQHDDYRNVDGKAIHRSVNKGGRKRKSIMAYIGLFFVCSIITGAILIPLMVSIEFMSSPSSWFTKSQNKNHTNGIINIVKLHKSTLLGHLSVNNKSLGYPDRVSTIATINDITINSTYPSETSIIPTTSISTPSLTTQQLFIGTNTSDIAHSHILSSVTPAITDDMEESKSRQQNYEINLHLPEQVASILTTNETSHQKVTTNHTEVKFILNNNLIAKNNPFMSNLTFMQTPLHSTISSNGNKSKVDSDSEDTHKMEMPWIKSKWEFNPPFNSPYFQWSNFESEDSIMLPAVLGFIVLTIILSILLCLVCKKRCCCNKTKKDGFTAVEAQDGDNAILLTNENNSDDE